MHVALKWACPGAGAVCRAQRALVRLERRHEVIDRHLDWLARTRAQRLRMLRSSPDGTVSDHEAVRVPRWSPRTVVEFTRRDGRRFADAGAASVCTRILPLAHGQRRAEHRLARFLRSGVVGRDPADECCVGAIRQIQARYGSWSIFCATVALASCAGRAAHLSRSHSLAPPHALRTRHTGSSRCVGLHFLLGKAYRPCHHPFNPQRCPRAVG